MGFNSGFKGLTYALLRHVEVTVYGHVRAVGLKTVKHEFIRTRAVLSKTFSELSGFTYDR